MLFKKPNHLKFTDLCIYIDQNTEKIKNPGEYPEIEETVYNYLWLLVKALAIKKRMFQNFEDYDMYAFYSATRLFTAIRKNQQNQGKVIKGKTIKPIKSCLNYTKALLYPMKVEYQMENFREVIEEEFVSTKFDALAYREKLKNQIRNGTEVSQTFQTYVEQAVSKSSLILEDILKKSPFNDSTAEYKNLKMSILLTSLHILKTEKKLNTSVQSAVLWHLPKSMAHYTKILTKEFFIALKNEIIDCYKMADIDDNDLENILKNNDKTTKLILELQAKKKKLENEVNLVNTRINDIYMDKINKVVSEEIFFNAYNTLLENNEKNKTELKEIDKKIYQLKNKLAIVSYSINYVFRIDYMTKLTSAGGGGNTSSSVAPTLLLPMPIEADTHWKNCLNELLSNVSIE